MYQWLKLYDGLDRWVQRKEECTDLPVPGWGLAMPRGLCTGAYVVGILRWLTCTSCYQMISTTSIIPEITSTHSTCTLPMPPMFVIQTPEIFLGERSCLIGLLTVCLFDYGWLRISCTFCKSLFLNRNDIKFKLCITWLVCHSFFVHSR